jgi:hypothetical protein
MLKDIVEVRPLDDHCLFLRFEDGAEGTVDVGQHVRFEGVFAWLRDRDNFLQVRIEPELGTIVWPNGADLDADVLYAAITGQPIDVARQSSGAGG